MNWPAALGTVLALVIAALWKVHLDRKDRKANDETKIRNIPDNPAGLRRFRRWLRDKKTGGDFQSLGGLQDPAGRDVGK